MAGRRVKHCKSERISRVPSLAISLHPPMPTLSEYSSPLEAELRKLVCHSQ